MSKDDKKDMSTKRLNSEEVNKRAKNKYSTDKNTT